ncbi:hypothetical protein E6O75_ATG02091 [Venturia nashicola]|uniref:Uncharacterized protein n=1 Tax=Venturia nashicola TaxID=86259 RepID=A0A4Z1P2L6_9PEZI|nr:hypothetical protein E6O75_ATG02091 [Venturia nashicola]
MVASDVVSTSTSTFVTIVTITFPTPTGSSVETLPKSSSNNNELLVGFASAGAFALFLFVIGLLFCLKHTRTKHRRRIEDLEHRLNGLEIQNRPHLASERKRFSTATGTSLGSSWGAWRSKNVKNFQKIRTANQTTASNKRKRFAHGWWSISSVMENQDHRQNGTPLQDITLSRAPPQLIGGSGNDLDPLVTPRLSVIAESPSQAPAPARLNFPAVKAPHRDSAVTETHADGLCDDKEINVDSLRVKIPSQNYDMSSIDKEVASTAEKRPAPPPPPSIPSKIHQRKPALAGAISIFPPGTLTGADTLHPTSTRYRPFSVINEDPSAAPRKLIAPPPPMRKPIPNRPSRSFSHIRNHSAFSDDSRSSMENPVAGCLSAQSNHARTISAQSNTIWPWNIHSPTVDYGSASDPPPRFKQHRSSKTVEFQNRLQHLTTSELDVSTAARIEPTDPRAADIANSYRTLTEKEERTASMANDSSNRKSETINSSHKPTSPTEGKHRFSSAPPSVSSHAIPDPASRVSSCPSSTRSREGNPFHYGESSDRLNSFHTTSTSYLKASIPRPRAGTDPVLNLARPASTSSTIRTRREAGKPREKKSKATDESSPDLKILIPTPTLHYHTSTFGTPKIRSSPKFQYARKVEPILEQDEPMRSANPVFEHLDWKKTLKAHVGTTPSPSFELVSPSNAPPRTASVNNRNSRDKDDETYNILNGSPLGCQSSFKKKSSLMGAIETFSSAEDRSLTTTLLSRPTNSDASGATKNSLKVSGKIFSSHADCSCRGTSPTKSPSGDDCCTNPIVRELKKTRRSALRSPLAPQTIAEDEAVDQRSPKVYSPFSPISASPAHSSSHCLRRQVSLKSIKLYVIPSPALTETTPSEIETLETKNVQNFPAITLPTAFVSSSRKPFAAADISSTASFASTRVPSPVTSIPPVRQGFGPGPSDALLEKWEKQGRSYITSQATITEEEDRGIQTFARGKAPRNLSPALGSEEAKKGGGETSFHPPIESSKKKIKNSRWESRGEIAEMIPPQYSSLQKLIKASDTLDSKPQVLPASHQRQVSKTSTTNTSENSENSVVCTASTSISLPKSPLKPLLKPSESAKRAEAVGMKKSIDHTNVSGEVSGSTSSKKATPRGTSPPRKRGPKVEELGKILGVKGVGW